MKWLRCMIPLTMLALYHEIAAQPPAKSQKAGVLSPNKQFLIQSVEKHKEELAILSDKIWGYA